MSKIANIRDWKPARQFPETYPGDRPSYSYFLINDSIYPIQFDHPLELRFENEVGETLHVDEVLKAFNLPLVKERFGLLCYGGNRNPATLYIKFLNYHYRSPGNGLAVPVLRGEISGADVVACGLSGQGYFYGDLLWNSALSHETRVEAWLALLDSDQLRVIHDSEGISGGDYIAAQFTGVTINGSHKSISPMGYAGRTPVLTSPKFKMPIAYKTVGAKGRTIPEMTAIEMLDHLIEGFDLREQVCTVTGIRNDVDLSMELMKYMNGQWWYKFNTGQRPINGYVEVMRLFVEKIKKHSLSESTAEQMARIGQALSAEETYYPDKKFTFSALIGDS